MGWVIGITSLFVIIFVFILFSRMHVEIAFTYNEKDKELLVSIQWLRLIKFNKTISFADLEEQLKEENDDFDLEEKLKSFNDDNEQDQSLMQKFNLAKHLLPEFKKMLKSIRLDQLEWVTSLGLKHADQTAMLTGLLYAVKGMVSSFFITMMQNETHPKMTVTPIYVKPTYETEVKCIFSFKIGQIMRDMFRILLQYKKFKKVGKHERASN